MASDVKCPTTTEMSRLESWLAERLPKRPLASYLGPEKPRVRQAWQLEVPRVFKDSSCVFSPSAGTPFNTAFPTSLTCAAWVPIVAKLSTQTDSTGGSRRGAGTLSSNTGDKAAATRATRDRMVWQKARARVPPDGISLNCGKMGAFHGRDPKFPLLHRRQREKLSERCMWSVSTGWISNFVKDAAVESATGSGARK